MKSTPLKDGNRRNLERALYVHRPTRTLVLITDKERKSFSIETYLSPKLPCPSHLTRCLVPFDERYRNLVMDNGALVWFTRMRTKHPDLAQKLDEAIDRAYQH